MGGHLGIFSIANARRLAQKRLSRMICNYFDRAASDERTAQLNMERLSDLRLMPRMLRNVGARRRNGQILAVDVGLGCGIALIGMCNLSWHAGDRALARPAATH